MLRRYSPRGIESTPLHIHTATLIGSGEVCDIVIKNKDVEEKHALVEFHPLTNSYWFRFISSRSGGTAFTHKHSATEEEEEGEDKTVQKSVNQTETSCYTAGRLKRSASAIGPGQQPVLQQQVRKELTEVASFADQKYKSKPEEHEPVARQRALEAARQELLNYGAMLELHPADTLRFGSGEEAVEYVFEMPPIVSKSNQQISYPKPKSSSTNSSSYSSFIMQRRSKKKKFHGKSASFELKERLEREILEIQEGIVLPVVGNKVNPRVHTDRFTRPQVQTHNRRLCHIASESPATNGLPSLHHHQSSQSSASPLRNRSSSVHSSKTLAKEKQDLVALGVKKSQNKVNNEGDAGDTEPRWPPLPNGPYYGESVSIEGNPGTSRQVGNQLLQRVVRLQAELQRRDVEIAQLRGNATIPSTSGDRAKRHLNNYREALSRAQTENENLKAHLEINTNMNKEEEKPKSTNSKIDFTELICNTFFKVCFEELDALNSKVSNSSARDYADIFSETMKALQEPFSFRLMEINTKCSATFECVKLGQADRDQLYAQFDKFLKEKIYPISKAFDAFLPILKDSAGIARESVRACNVFSQWSREFGDQLQLQPSWELMAFKADDLQTRFREWGMSKHWLPPSLLPLLKILIYEHKNQLEDQKRRDTEYLSEKSRTDTKIAELEEQLQSSNSKLKEFYDQKVEGPSEPGDYHELKVKNEELLRKVEELQEQIGLLSLSGKVFSSAHTINPTDEYTEVPKILLQNSFETERRLSLGKLSNLSKDVTLEFEELEERRGNEFENNELPDSHPPSRRTHFDMGDLNEIAGTTNYEPEATENLPSSTEHENNQRNKGDTRTEENFNQLATHNLVDNDLVDSEEVDGMIRLKTEKSREQERSASSHSKESREDFYKTLQLGAQSFKFDEKILGKSPEEDIDEEEEEEESRSSHQMNTSVEDSELAESRPLSQVESNPDTPRPAPDQIEDIDSATPQDDDFYHDVDVHSSDDEHVTQTNFEQMDRIYDELENRRRREESTNLTTTEAYVAESAPKHNSLHSQTSQLSQSSMETVKEVFPENRRNIECTEDGCCIMPSRNSVLSERAKNRSKSETPTTFSLLDTPKSPSPGCEKLENEEMENGQVRETDDKSDKRNTESVYETEFILRQSPASNKIISQHHNNAIQFWHLASLLAQMLRVDIPAHDSLDHSLNTQDLEGDKNINYQEIELRQTAVNTIIEKLELLLDNLRSSAGVEGPPFDSEDSGHCNSSSTTDGSKHELGQTIV